jgi:hypothetical protein
MRSVIGLGLAGALCAGSMGCFEAAATPDAGLDEAQAVAEALTRKVEFENGTLLEGFLPDETAPEVELFPLEETLLMAPGDTSLMALDVDNPDEADDPLEATLVQFGEAVADHVEVARASKGGEPPVQGERSRLENRFSVQADICDLLCNKRYTVKLFEAGKTRSGKVGKHRQRTLVLECTELGDPNRCPKGDADDPGSEPMTGGDSGTRRDAGAMNGDPDAGAAFDAGSAGAGGTSGRDAGPIDVPDAGEVMLPEDAGTGGVGGGAGFGGAAGVGGAGEPDAAVAIDAGA